MRWSTYVQYDATVAVLSLLFLLILLYYMKAKDQHCNNYTHCLVFVRAMNLDTKLTANSTDL